MAAMLLLILSGRKTIKRVSMVILVIIVVSIMSLLVGLMVAGKHLDSVGTRYPNVNTLHNNLLPDSTFDFSSALSLLLPCWIGLFSGVNNAARLSNPFESIPRGIFWALGISGILYCVEFILLASTIDRKLLTDNNVPLLVGFPSQYVTVPGVLIVGVGAALQCLLIASTTLQGIMRDFEVSEHAKRSVVTKLKQVNRYGEPMWAVIFSVMLALPLLLIPDLEHIAKIATLCFLLCYGSTNLACCLFAAFESTMWRPKFKYQNATFAALGCFMCIFMMF